MQGDLVLSKFKSNVLNDLERAKHKKKIMVTFQFLKKVLIISLFFYYNFFRVLGRGEDSSAHGGHMLLSK